MADEVPNLSAHMSHLFTSSQDSTIRLPELSSSQPECSGFKDHSIVENLLSSGGSTPEISDSEGEDEAEFADQLSKNENIDLLAESLKMMLGMTEDTEYRKKAFCLMEDALNLEEFKERVKEKITEFMNKAENRKKHKEILVNFKKKGVRTKQRGPKKTIRKPKENRCIHLNTVDLITSLRSHSQTVQLEQDVHDLISSSQNSLFDAQIDGILATEEGEKTDELLDTTVENIGDLSTISSLTFVPSLNTSLPSCSETEEDQLEMMFDSSQNLL